MVNFGIRVNSRVRVNFLIGVGLVLPLSCLSSCSHVYEETLGLLSNFISGLSKLPSAEAQKLAFDLAQRWIRTMWLAYKKYGAMFEKVNLLRLQHFSRLSGTTLTPSDSKCDFSSLFLSVRREPRRRARWWRRICSSGTYFHCLLIKLTGL